MFTEEFIIMSVNYSIKKSNARDAESNLKKLGISNKEVTQELDRIKAACEIFNMLAVNYMYSFVPEELKTKLSVDKITGAFATATSSAYKLSASIKISLGSEDIRLLFDNKNKCLYIGECLQKDTDFYKEISMYINPAPDGYNEWLEILYK